MIRLPLFVLRFRLAWVCLGLLGFAAVTLHAQVTPVPFTEIVTFSMRGTGAGIATMTVYGQSTQDVSLSLSGTVAETNAQNVSLKPGQQYPVHYSGGSATGEYWLSYKIPEGYYLLIDNVVASMSHMAGVAAGYQRDYMIELKRGASSGGSPLSTFSGIQIGKSITWEVGLGTKNHGQSANLLTFKEWDLSSGNDPVDASRLMWAPPPNFGELRVETDPGDSTFIRQITVPSGFLDIKDDSGGNGYWLNFYRKEDIQGNPDGLDFPKTTAHVPWKTIRVEQPATNQLKITVTHGSTVEVSFLQLIAGAVDSGNYTWQLQEGDNSAWALTTIHQSSATANGREVVITVYDGASTSAPVAAVTKQVFEKKPWGEQLVQTIRDPNGAALTTTIAYHENSSDLGNYRRVKSVTQSDGSWRAMWYYDEWDMRGQLQYEYAPFASIPATAPTLSHQSNADAALSAGRTVEYTYEEDWTTRYGRVSERLERIKGHTSGKSTWSYTDILGNGHDWNKVEATQSTFRDVTNTTTQKSLRYRADAAHDDVGRVIYAEQAGISRSVSSVAAGNYTPPAPPADHDASDYDLNSWNGYLRYVTMHGLVSASGTSTSVSSWDGQAVETVHMEPNRSTMDVVITFAGHTLRTERRVFTSSGTFELIAWTDNTYDDYWRLTGTEDHLGSIEGRAYVGGRLDTVFGADGNQTEYDYDELGRVETSTLFGVASRTAEEGGAAYPAQSDIVTTFAHSGLNRSTTVVSGSLSKTTSSVYDLAGRPVSQSEPAPHGGNYTTGITYASGGLTATTTRPGGATQITTKHLDGQIASVGGSSVIAETYDYDVTTGGNRIVAKTTGGLILTETETEFDWMGHKIEERLPGWNGGADRVLTWTYNNLGQLTKTTAPGTADVLHFYDHMGYHYRTVVDRDADGLVDLDGPDSITDTTEAFSNTTLGSGAWALVQTQSAYITENDDDPTSMGTTVSRITGFTGAQVAETRMTDVFGNVTVSTTARYPNDHLVVTTVDAPASSQDAIEVSYFGRKVESIDTTGFHVSYDYDDFGRLVRQSHPRLGSGTTGNYGSNLTTYYGSTAYVQQVTDHSGVPRKKLTYDAAGRVATEQNAEGIALAAGTGLVRYAYNDRGQLTHTWGDATYPVASVYDPNTGQRTIMKTYRGNDTSPVDWNSATWPGGSLVADLTAWAYDPYTGLLDHKYDAANVDANGTPLTGAKSVAYTYNAVGQLATRTWARGTVTTYTYDPVTGELVDADYSDATPDVTNVYNRRGLLESVTVGTHTRTFDYCICGKVAAEHLGSAYDNQHLVYHFDATTGAGTTGRTLGYSLTDNATTPNILHEVDYTYDTYGRFDTLTTGGAMGTHTVDYTYDSDANLITGYTVDATNTDHFSLSRGWVTNRNLVASVATSWGATPVVQAGFAYTYDTMNRRLTAIQHGAAFADYGTTDVGAYTSPTHRRYGYNARSELVTDYTYANGDNTATTPTDTMADRSFVFAYDDIGNRISSNRTGTAGLADAYQRNALNQYTSRENNTLTVSGTVATSSALVAARILNDSQGPGGPWVNADRVAGYWSTSLVPRNATTPTLDTVDVVSVDEDAGSGGEDLVDRDSTRQALVHRAAEDFAYDDDGNLLRDSVWVYEWDAENRLVRLFTRGADGTGADPHDPALDLDGSDPIHQASDAVWTSGVPRQDLVFTYDHLHRRVTKTASTWNATTSEWDVQSDRRFTYDGWNLIYEEELNASPATARSYAWGLDLQGSRQDAGGVGALVAVYDQIENSAGKLLLPGYDANGNIAVMLNGTDGTLEAAYEYGPFGELLRADGPSAQLNPFRFSTKYTDEETGLVYYGRRYYDSKNGRFLGRDPLGEKGGRNLYAFVRNRPVNAWDYLGMAMCTIRYPVVETVNRDVYTSGSGAAKKTTYTYEEQTIYREMQVPCEGDGMDAFDRLRLTGSPDSSYSINIGNQDIQGTITISGAGYGEAMGAFGNAAALIDDYNATRLNNAISSDELQTLVMSGPMLASNEAPNSATTNAGGLTLGDQVRIAMGVANSVSPNPVAGMIDKGVAVGQMTGSVSAGINAAINPVYGVLEGGYQNITGRSLHPDAPQATLTFGQRVLSGISAELNLASTVGVGMLGAQGVTTAFPALNNIRFIGPTPAALDYSNGGLFQVISPPTRVLGVDIQPIPGSGGQPVLHFHLNFRGTVLDHVPIPAPPPAPGPVPPPI